MRKQDNISEETRKAWHELGDAFIEALEELDTYGTAEEWEEQDEVEEQYYGQGLYE